VQGWRHGPGKIWVFLEAGVANTTGAAYRMRLMLLPAWENTNGARGQLF